MEKPHRKIRSFVRRDGRITRAQQQAIDNLWPRFGVEMPDTNTTLALPDVFGNDNPVTLEIGFGNGDSLHQMAAAEPDSNFLGIEVYRSGIGHLLQACERDELNNLRLMCHDATEVVELAIPARSLNRVQIYFPDPWHKKRHHKRRLIQSDFVELLADRLTDGGELHVATDWDDYAEHILDVFSNSTRFELVTDPAHFHQRPRRRPETRFERRGQKRGHRIWDLIFHQGEPLKP